MNYANMYQQFETFAHDCFRKKLSKDTSFQRLKEARSIYHNWTPLTDNQKKEIAAYWGLKHPAKSDFITHEIMMNVKGDYDVRYCSEKIFRVYLDPALGNRNLIWAWDDKNYFDRFQPGIPFPHTFVRNVNGYFLDHDYNPVSMEEAKKIILANLPLIIKPALLCGGGLKTGEGKGVKLITCEKEAEEIFSSYKKNYLLQEVVEQCDELKKMSPRSVNTFRLVTAMVKGEPKLLTSHLLCNTTDAVASNTNLGPGEGVVIIATDHDGKLYDTGYFENSQKIKTLPSGFTFGQLQIPSYNEMVNLALEAQKSMPMLGIIGWDVTIDINNKPVFIEWNLHGIEIYHSQLSNGPIFGEYSDCFAEMAKKIMSRRE